MLRATLRHNHNFIECFQLGVLSCGGRRRLGSFGRRCSCACLGSSDISVAKPFSSNPQRNLTDIICPPFSIR
jgi:hypothetical protein